MFQGRGLGRRRPPPPPHTESCCYIWRTVDRLIIQLKGRWSEKTEKGGRAINWQERQGKRRSICLLFLSLNIDHFLENTAEYTANTKSGTQTLLEIAALTHIHDIHYKHQLCVMFSPNQHVCCTAAHTDRVYKTLDASIDWFTCYQSTCTCSKSSPMM